MTLRLRCVRCGEWDEMDPCASIPGLCGACDARAPGLVPRRDGRWSAAKRVQWRKRWQKNQERHPTYRALQDALEKLENTPHGTLGEGSISVGGADVADEVLAFMDTGASR